MRPETKAKYEIMAAWCGALLIVTYIWAWTFVAHIQPPLPYTATPAEAAEFYLSRRDAILVGMALSAIFGAFWIPWSGQLAVVLWRIEGEGPVFAMTSLIGGALTAYALMFTPIMWMMPAFRPDADPKLIQSLSDMAYLTFNSTFAVTSMQALPAGLVALADKRPDRVFPRWVAWIAVATAFLMAPVALTPFFATGPFSLDGWFNGWIPGIMYFVWCGTMTFFMIKDAHRRHRLVKASA